MIKINLDLDRAKSDLASMRARMQDTRPLMREVSNIMLNAVKTNFAVGGRPSWTPSARAKAEGGQTLIKTTHLLRSVHEAHGKDYAMVGSNLAYAAIHHFGGRTRPHVIRPRDAGALYWPGAAHPFSSVNHPGSRIPARPIFTLAPVDTKEIYIAARTHAAGEHHA